MNGRTMRERKAVKHIVRRHERERGININTDSAGLIKWSYKNEKKIKRQLGDDLAMGPFQFNLLSQIGQNVISFSKVTLQPINLVSNRLHVVPESLKCLPLLGPARAFSQFTQFTLLVLQKLQGLLLNQGPVWSAVVPRTVGISPVLRGFIGGFQLGL